MLPAQAWEPGKVAIGRDERRIVLERERGKIRVLDEIAAAIGTAAEIAKNVEVCLIGAQSNCCRRVDARIDEALELLEGR